MPHATPKFPLSAALLLGALAPGAQAADPALEAAIEDRVETQEVEAAAQASIDTLSADTDALVAEYRQVVAERETLQVYNDQLARLVANQEEELAGFEAEMANAEATQTRLVPLLGRMVGTLKEFVELDLPFLQEERRGRVASLEKLLDDAAVTLPEKYRRIMEAYQVESEYGRTLEAYRGELQENGQRRAVEFLRIGRVALLYAALDGSETGFWDPAAGAWKPLPAGYDDEVLAGLKVARKEAPPELIQVPVTAPGAPE